MRSRRSPLSFVAVATLVALAATSPEPAMAATGEANQRFVIVAHQTTTAGRVTATGPISGVGTDTLLDHKSNPDGTYTDVDRFDLPLGQVVLSDTYTALVRSDAITCVSKITVSGTYHIVAGTGRYTGTAGSGTFTATGTLVAHRDRAGACLDPPPAAFEEVVHGTGSTALH